MSSTQSDTELVRKPFQKGTELTEMELMYAETFKELEEGRGTQRNLIE